MDSIGDTLYRIAPTFVLKYKSPQQNRRELPQVGEAFDDPVKHVALASRHPIGQLLHLRR